MTEAPPAEPSPALWARAWPPGSSTWPRPSPTCWKTPPRAGAPPRSGSAWIQTPTRAAGRAAAVGRYRAAPELRRIRARRLLARPHPHHLGTIHPCRPVAPHLRRDTADLAMALEFYDRWLPGSMRRIADITRTCMPQSVMLRSPRGARRTRQAADSRGTERRRRRPGHRPRAGERRPSAEEDDDPN